MLLVQKNFFVASSPGSRQPVTFTDFFWNGQVQGNLSFLLIFSEMDSTCDFSWNGHKMLLKFFKNLECIAHKCLHLECFKNQHMMLLEFFTNLIQKCIAHCSSNSGIKQTNLSSIHPSIFIH
jgi:hypothetical protein